MRSYLLLVLLGLFSFGVLGCRSIVQPQTRDRFDENQLKMVQFYVSRDIELTRVLAYGESASVSSGRVIFVDGQRKERVRISYSFWRFWRRTPGVMVGMLNSDDGEWLLISFEENNDNLFLPFSRQADRFVLAPHKVDWPNTQYGDAIFRISYRRNKTPHLLWRESARFGETGDFRRVRGRRIN